ncbi:MAG: 3-dehydroquinate synthase [Peptococcia bacterium]
MREEISQVQVQLGERAYQIIIGYDILSTCLTQLQGFSGSGKVMLISDENVYALYGHKLESYLSQAGYQVCRFVVLPGEETKSWEQAGIILEEMLDQNLERQTPLLALGGGVVGDLAGFVAALYRRGMPLFQLPTTLLAQVDSSIGGKVAVNHPKGKNMFGTFYQPAGVWADLTSLSSLDDQEWAAGLAEVAKYAVIRDQDFFNYLEQYSGGIFNKDRRYLPTVIEKCCQIKADIVSRDERDEGLRNILNFGHTYGHALESATNYQEYRHGEAVAIGMAAVLELAFLLKLISIEERDRVISLLESWHLPTCFAGNLLDEVLNNLSYDKKVQGRKITFILPLKIGEVQMRSDIPQDLLRLALSKRCI